MEDSLEPTGARMLRVLLNRISSIDDIAAALGIQDPSTEPEEFWDIQRMTARNRFLGMCLAQQGMELSLELDDLTDAQADEVAAEAEQFLDAGGRYATVRDWYLQRGALAMKLAFDARRENRRLAALGLRVLLVFDKGAKYLAYGPNPADVRLVDTPQEAYVLPVRTSSQTEKPYLLELALLFDAVKAKFGAKELKVLCGQRG